jgi:phosphoserine phosphatase
MTRSDHLLPSWREGTTRDALLTFLEASASLAPADRVATFDNDGTLWCERPAYLQFLFFVDALQRAAETDPSLRDRPEFAAVLSNDQAAIGELGLARVGMALNGLFAGLTPEAFSAATREFVDRAVHPVLGLPARRTVYQPMLELIDALRGHGFAVFVVSGGGTEFVRAVSHDLYGVPPEGVVGTLVQHEMVRRVDGGVELRRTNRLDGEANEGAAKVTRIQSHLGRRPVFAAGNSGGDREMLEWVTSGEGPSLALVIDHDDAEREFAYQGRAESFAEAEAITEVAARLGWTLASIANDWATVFPSAD